MRILFSPIGMTDPIRFFKDGALLNITRHYKPDLIYLYMSKEVCELHQADNRYVYCLERLGDLTGKKFEIKKIERPELEDVQIFDSFLSEFRDILNSIHAEHPDDEIILNVSSGTPAMKSSLQILSLTLDYPCTPIQVSTPQKSSNPHSNDEASLTPEERWELNESNDEYDNRCIESRSENLLTEFKKQMVQKLILSYDYPAAYKMIEDSGTFSKKFKELVFAACCRMKLDYSKTKTVFRKYGIPFDSASEKEALINDISEYLLLLKLKIYKNEYADFVRAITPVLVSLCSVYLKNKCAVDISQYTKTIKKDFDVWSNQKLQGTKIFDILNQKYGSFKDESPLSSDSLIEIIYNMSSDADVKIAAANIRSVEVKIRNSAAHTIVSIKDEDIKSISGFSAKEIFDMIKKIFTASGYTFRENAYDKMNDIILNEI